MSSDGVVDTGVAARIAARGWEVPAFEERVLRPHAGARFAVVVPVLNEGERFLRQVDRMAGHLGGADLVVADGGSVDGVPEAFGADGLAAAVLVKRGPGRLGAQLRMAFAWCLDRGYRGIVTVDGNGKDGTEAIPEFLRLLESGADFVQGSRYLPGGAAVNTPADRHLAVRLLHAPVVSLGAGLRYTDTTNGFRGHSARLLEDPRVAPFRNVFDSYNLLFYLSVRAGRLGLRVEETPVTRSYPTAGPAPTKISGIRGRASILRQTFAAALGFYDPPETGV